MSIPLKASNYLCLKKVHWVTNISKFTFITHNYNCIVFKTSSDYFLSLDRTTLHHQNIYILCSLLNLFLICSLECRYEILAMPIPIECFLDQSDNLFSLRWLVILNVLAPLFSFILLAFFKNSTNGFIPICINS